MKFLVIKLHGAVVNGIVGTKYILGLKTYKKSAVTLHNYF